METIRCYIVDSSPLNREGLRRLLDGTDVVVLADASRLEGLGDDLVRGLDPDCVIVQVDRTGDAVFKFVDRARKLIGGTKLICITSQSVPDVLHQAFAAGADALLNEDISPDVLIRSVHLVIQGEKVFPSSLIGKLLQQGACNGAGIICAEPPKNLTEREVEVLRCVASGAANKVIAHRLGIDEGTVKTHVRSVQRKLQVHNRTQAAIWALHHGLAEPHDG